MESRLIWGVVLCGVLVGCAPTPERTAAPGSPPGAPAAAPEVKAPPSGVVPGTAKDVWYVDPWSLGYDKPRDRGGTFTYAVNTAPPTLNPWGRKLFSEVFLNSTYDGLLARRLAPGTHSIEVDVFCRLCESWQLKPDQKTWAFKLRQNVKFHDGVEFTGDDVKFSYEHAMDPKTGSEFRSLLDTTIARIDVPDKYAVEITTREPDGDLLNKLGFGGLVIVSKRAVESGVDLNKTIVGTGPFKLERFDRETEYVAVRNPDFWIPERPSLDKLVGRFIGDKSTRAAGFIAKQLDIHTTFDLREMEPVQKAVSGAQVEKYPGPDLGWLVNIRKKPLDDVRVRRAMHLATDREEISRQLTGGLSKVYLGPSLAYAWLSKAFTQEEMANLSGYRKPKEQEVAEAKRLLAEAGYPNGFKVASNASAQSSSNAPISEAGAGQMKKIGIEVILDHTDGAVAAKTETECLGELSTATSTTSQSILVGQVQRFTTGASMNFCGYSNAEYDRLFLQYTRSFAADERWRLAKRMEQILFDELPFIPLGSVVHHAIWHPWVHNYRNYGHSWAFPWAPVVELIWVEPR